MSSSSDESESESRSRKKFDGSSPEKWDSFEKFVLRSLAKKTGREIAEQMWANELPDVADPALFPAPMLEQHAELVLKQIRKKSETRAAKFSKRTHGFWTREWQATWLQDQYEAMYDIVETSVKGQAEIVLDGIERCQAYRIRSVLWKKFGGSAEDMEARERRFKAAMPDAPGRAPFPPGVDMAVKLRQLSSERRKLYKLCPIDKRTEYEYGKETTLVKIVLDNLYGTEWEKPCKDLVRDVRLQLQIKSCMPVQDARGDWKPGDGNVDGDPTANFDDWDIRNFSTEWLPAWERLESALVGAWKEKTYRGGSSTSTTRLPNAVSGTTMLQPGFGQRNGEPSSRVVRCFACGEMGHRMGDSVCKVAPGTIHESAPDYVKKRNLERSTKERRGTKHDICYHFQKHGKCKFGDKCRFKHVKGDGGGGVNLDKIASIMITKLKQRVKLAKKRKGKRDKKGDGPKKKKTKNQKKNEESDDGDDESWLSSFMMVTIPRERKGGIPLDVTALASSPLHDLRDVAVDTASACTISTDRDDFLYIDESEKAKASVSINGPSVGTPKCGGIGVAVYRIESDRHTLAGRNLSFIDPFGVYAPPEKCPPLRILSAQAMSKMGCGTVTGVFGQGGAIQCAQSGESVKLKTDNNILVLRTKGKACDIQLTPELRAVIKDVESCLRPPLIDLDDLAWNAEGGHYYQQKGAWAGYKKKSFSAIMLMLTAVTCLLNPTSIMLNEAKLKIDERTRLWCRRFGFCDTANFPKMHEMPEYGEFPKTRVLNEDVKGANMAKFKKKSYRRNAAEVTMDSPPWWRVYCDGYGGQGSLGGTSFEGATGGYLFVCPATGSEDLRLYASHEQFPVALSMFLRRVEAEHYTTHVMFVDTHSINISEEAELVASLYGVNILPVAAGSPEEMAFVESRVRLLKRHSTAQMLGAPHLPASFWALSDKYAVYTRQFLPQSTRDFHCSFYLRTGRVINWRLTFIKNFGAPCHYVPGDGPVHKRGAVVKTGVFVGVQYPAVLVYRDEEPKCVISVSMKKVVVYESQYLKELDEMVKKGDITGELKLRALQTLPTPEELPVDDGTGGCAVPLADTVGGEGRQVSTDDLAGTPPARVSEGPGRQSPLKVRFVDELDARDDRRAPAVDGSEAGDDVGYVLHRGTSRGEGGNDMEQDDGDETHEPPLPKVRVASKQTLSDAEIQASRDTRQSVGHDQSRKNAEVSGGGKVFGKRGFASCMGERDLPQVDLKTVQSIKTLREHRFAEKPEGNPTTKLDISAEDGHLGMVEGEEGVYVSDLHAQNIINAKEDIEKATDLMEKSIVSPSLRRQVVKKLKEVTTLVDGPAVQKGQLKVGKRSEVGGVSKDNVVGGKRRPKKSAAEEYLHEAASRSSAAASAMKRKKKIAKGDLVSCASTIFDGDEPGSYSDGQPERCYGVATSGVKRGVVTVRWKDDDATMKIMAKDLRVEYEKVNNAKIVALLVEGKKVAFVHAGKEQWPKDFFELLVKDDWREWVAAVKKELEGWNDNNAVTLTDAADVPPNAKVVPLGELYTIKRDGRYKFRQYLMGNLLREGVDYGETFSTTISMPGVCTFYSIATTCEKEVLGWDAVCGYLQVKEQYDLFAFLPSHQMFSGLPYEDLAELRKQLLGVMQKEGMEGVKRFAKKMKRDARVNPKNVLKLNSAIYGGASAGHDFEMLMHSTHIDACGLTQTQPEPSMYVRIVVDMDDKVVGYLVAIAWTDDVRFFGTDPEVKKYLQDVKRKLKIEVEKPPVTEFVGIETHQDLKRNLSELKMPKYWEKGLEKFANHFPNGCRTRKVPISVEDEKVMMTEATAEEVAEGKGLPYLEMLGVISYSASSCKPEMRYFVSICGSRRVGWSKRHFEVLKKGFEYGYTTREMGLIFSKGLDPHGENIVYAYADSSHGLPRSQGCRIVMMNGACLSCHSKRHSLTAASTCVDELIEFAECTVDVAATRNLLAELGLYQQAPTKVYQDNQAAIQIANNRGSLGVTSRAIDFKTLSARNRIEDMQVETCYCPTPIMRADIGTKALPEHPFVHHRDIINGYALVKCAYPGKKLPDYVHVGDQLTHNQNLSALCLQIMNSPFMMGAE